MALNTFCASAIEPEFVTLPVLLKVAPSTVTVPEAELVKLPAFSVTGALYFPMLNVADSRLKLPEFASEPPAPLVKFPKLRNVPRLSRVPVLVKLKLVELPKAGFEYWISITPWAPLVIEPRSSIDPLVVKAVILPELVT